MKRRTTLAVAACVTATVVIAGTPSFMYGSIIEGACYFGFDVDGDGENDGDATAGANLRSVRRHPDADRSKPNTVDDCQAVSPTRHQKRPYQPGDEQRTAPNVCLANGRRGPVLIASWCPSTRILSLFH